MVLTCLENTICQNTLAVHKNLCDVIKVGAFELADRANFVRQILSQYGKELDESAFNNQVTFVSKNKRKDAFLTVVRRGNYTSA